MAPDLRSTTSERLGIVARRTDRLSHDRTRTAPTHWRTDWQTPSKRGRQIEQCWNRPLEERQVQPSTAASATSQPKASCQRNLYQAARSSTSWPRASRQMKGIPWAGQAEGALSAAGPAGSISRGNRTTPRREHLARTNGFSGPLATGACCQIPGAKEGRHQGQPPGMGGRATASNRRR